MIPPQVRMRLWTKKKGEKEAKEAQIKEAIKKEKAQKK